MKKTKVKYHIVKASKSIYPQNTRVVVRVDDEYFIGTIRDLKDKSYVIELNNGQVINIPFDSRNIIGVAKKSSRKDPIPVFKVVDYLAKDRDLRTLEKILEEHKEVTSRGDLKVGSRVVVKFGKFYYVGTIKRITPKFFTIKFDDGKVEKLPCNTENIIGIIDKVTLFKKPLDLNKAKKLIVKLIKEKSPSEKSHKENIERIREIFHKTSDPNSQEFLNFLASHLQIISETGSKEDKEKIFKFVVNDVLPALSEDGKINLFKEVVHLTSYNREMASFGLEILREVSDDKIIDLFCEVSSEDRKHDKKARNVKFFILTNDKLKNVIKQNISSLLERCGRTDVLLSVIPYIKDSKEILRVVLNSDEIKLRESFVRTCDPSLLVHFIDDKDDEIRDIVVGRIHEKYLPKMINDKSKKVRSIVAKRIDPKYLPEMINDPSEEVRYEVAQRIDSEYLPQMKDDKSDYVRMAVVERIDHKYLEDMVNDPNFYVKETIIGRIDYKLVKEIILREKERAEKGQSPKTKYFDLLTVAMRRLSKDDVDDLIDDIFETSNDVIKSYMKYLNSSDEFYEFVKTLFSRKKGYVDNEIVASIFTLAPAECINRLIINNVIPKTALESGYIYSEAFNNLVIKLDVKTCNDLFISYIVKNPHEGRKFHYKLITEILSKVSLDVLSEHLPKVFEFITERRFFDSETEIILTNYVFTRLQAEDLIKHKNEIVKYFDKIVNRGLLGEIKREKISYILEAIFLKLPIEHIPKELRELYNDLQTSEENIFKIKKKFKELFDPIPDLIDKDVNTIKEYFLKVLPKYFALDKGISGNVKMLKLPLLAVSHEIVDCLHRWKEGSSVEWKALKLKFLESGNIFCHDSLSPDSIKYLEESYRLDERTYQNDTIGFKFLKALSQAIIELQYPEQDTIFVFRGTIRDELMKKGETYIALTNSLSSWTTDLNVAVKFARKQRDKGVVLRAEVKKEDVAIAEPLFADIYADEYEIVLSGNKPIEVVVFDVYFL